MKKLTKAENQAFEILEHIVKLEKDYMAVNALLAKQSDFMRVDYCQDKLHTKLTSLLDTILGNDSLATWFLYDRPKAAANIRVGKKEYTINTVEDLKNYYKEMK